MNDLAVGGIMSGLDTNAIVETLTKQARKPLERFQKDIDLSVLEKEVYQSVFDELGKLDNAAIKLNLEGTYNTTKAASSRSSSITATTLLGAKAGNYEVEVKQVAENPSITLNLEIDPKMSLSEVFNDFQSGVVTINNTNLYVSNNDTIASLVDKINNTGGALSASYDESSKRLNIQSTDPENRNKILVGGSNDSSNLFELLNVLDNKTTQQEVGENGKPAIVVVDGREIESNTNEIKDAIEGVVLEVKNVSNGPVKISVENNMDNTLNTLADFIVQYNTIVEKLQFKELTDQEKAYLAPLSQEKRDSMTDKEIDEYTEKWQELNKNEIARKSNELTMLYNDMRATINTPINIDGDGIKSLQDLGIEFVRVSDYRKYPYLLVESTDKDDVMEALRNDTKLTTKLEENPEEVYRFFAYKSDETNGFNANIRNVIDKYYNTGGIIQNKIKKGGAIDLKIQESTKRMEEAQKRVDQELERYWRQFSAMEDTLGQLQEQSSSLTNMISGNATG